MDKTSGFAAVGGGQPLHRLLWRSRRLHRKRYSRFPQYGRALFPIVRLSARDHPQPVIFPAESGGIFRFYRDKMLAPDAQPNAAHRKLAELEQAGRLRRHHPKHRRPASKAGSRTVYELHGSVHRNTCRRCGRRFSLDEILHTTGIPTCPCGGIIKPDVVLYEEPLDESTVARAVRAIEQADLLIVGGTSLSVYPAAGLLRYYRGGRLVLINRDPTPFDEEAGLLIQEPIGRVLGALCVPSGG